jgi:hypothetical protein
VGDVDGTGQRLDERGGFGRRPGFVVQSARQAAAFDPLQGEEGTAFVGADLIELHDVGVLHPRHQLRLQPETKLLAGGRELAGQHHLHGRQTVQAPVPRLVHHPHAAAAYLGQDVVIADLLGHRDIRRSGRPALLPAAQNMNRRAPLIRAGQEFLLAGRVAPEPRNQRVAGR